MPENLGIPFALERNTYKFYCNCQAIQTKINELINTMLYVGYSIFLIVQKKVSYGRLHQFAFQRTPGNIQIDINIFHRRGNTVVSQ